MLRAHFSKNTSKLDNSVLVQFVVDKCCVHILLKYGGSSHIYRRTTPVSKATCWLKGQGHPTYPPVITRGASAASARRRNPRIIACAAAILWSWLTDWNRSVVSRRRKISRTSCWIVKFYSQFIFMSCWSVNTADRRPLISPHSKILFYLFPF